MTAVWTFSERTDMALEAMAAARPLAERLAAPLRVLTLGDDADILLHHGATEVVRARGVAEPMLADSLSAVLDGCIDADALVVVVGGTRLGVEAASRLAQRRRLACGTHVLSLEAGDGCLRVERRCLGGRFIEREDLSLPCVATVQARHFTDTATCAPPQGAVREVAAPVAAPRGRLLGSRARPRSRVDIEKASVLVAAGRGVRERADLAMLEELAGLLGGEVAGSRPMVDDRQWLPADVKVGLSGRTVKPGLYVACGVAGLVEHLVGMRGARVVVSINSDPAAPIHEAADYQVVGDLYEIVPALIEALRQRGPK